MSTAKTIRTQVGSIKNTQKITKAMQLVAASKIRRVQERMLASRPYAEKIRSVIGHVANSHSEFRHPYLQPHEQVKRVGFIIISSDRGLCGGLNTNLFKHLIVGDFHNLEQQNIGVDLCLLGKKAVNFFKHTHYNIVAHAESIGPSTVADIVGAVKAILSLYDQGSIDQLFLVHNQFVNRMVQRPYVQRLLPLEVAEDESKGHYWDYIYEPNALDLLDKLLRRFLESQVYQAVIENVACEHAARMIAMKSATDNAAELINDLLLIYNKTRQAVITNEIIEIVSGAAAV
jgi:F-type H+-transporting ATPase subunit gamma